jgi:hypothetical protein
LFLAIDANFRLKLKARDVRDPELAPGSLYFVDPVKFQQHLKSPVDEGEVSQVTLLVLDSLMMGIDRDLWGRIPCGQSSELEDDKGFLCFWRRRCCLPTWPSSQERCGRPAKRRAVGCECTLPHYKTLIWLGSSTWITSSSLQ